MTITSKFQSKCKKCGGFISAGQQIEWSKETGPQHLGPCPEIKSQASKPRIGPSPRKCDPPIAPGQPGPYAGKFKHVEKLYNETERAVAQSDWLTDAANRLGAVPPLDALRDAMTLVQLQQQRVDAAYRKNSLTGRAVAPSAACTQ